MTVLIGTPLDDTLAGDADSDNTILGDAADTLPLGTTGGNDHLAGGSNSTNLLSGDAETLQGVGIGIVDGGNDVLIGGESSTNRMFGDATGSFEAARGGDDVLTGGNDSVNTMSGDAGGDLQPFIFRGVSPSFGGNDTLVGGERSTNTMFGDAAGDLNVSVGGSDHLIGGADSSNILVGDAGGVLLSSTGGDDTLIAGDGGTNTLIGDALILAGGPDFGGSTGGDDLLVSGTGTDDMWGDGKQLLDGSIGGADVFRFLADNGNDFIHDFERGKDLIDVTAISTAAAAARSAGSLSAFAALGRADLDGLMIEEIDADGDGTTDSVIHFDAENSVTVLGVTGLSNTDFVVPPSSYVLFSRTSTGGGHRDEWARSEANSQPSTTPGSTVPASTFDADLATGPGTALDGPGAADYAADGVLQNANLAMFNLTEAPSGTFVTDAPADLAARIAAGTPFFGTANTDLDPAQSDIDLAAGKLHLAQTDADRDGIKNLEISLDSATSLRDIRLENFVDTRLKLGEFLPHSDQPPGERFEVQLLGAERGEVDASEAPQAMDLLLAPRTNDGTFQNSFVIKGSLFDDTVTIEAGAVSGSMLGAGSIDNTIVGENSISLGETGGNDTLTGGGNSSNSIFGDALGDLFAASGGNDTVIGGADSTNVMSGDAQFSLRASNDGGSGGGNDVLTGGANSINTMYGDAGGSVIAIAFRHGAGGGNDVLTGGDNSTNVMYGDAGGTAVGGSGGRDHASAGGGADTLIGGDNSVNTMVGDFRNLSAFAFSGSDLLIGGANSTNTIIGDVEEDAIGPEFGFGDDTLIGGANSTNVLCGDFGGDFNAPPFSGGNDTITGGDNSTNTMFGDARVRAFFGGSDILIGGASSTNVMFGDAGVNVIVGGNDTLIAGAGGSNVLVGDAGGGGGSGDDLLVSGTGTDDMWGDSQSEFSKGGHDVFRFAADNGNDFIHDFERGTDLIEVTARFLLPATVGMGAQLAAFAAPAQSDLGSLRIEERDANGDGTTDSIIHFDAENSVTVLGVTGLTSEDIVATPGTSYVLFGRTSLPNGTRVKWVGSEANSLPSDTPGSSVSRSAFDADTATGAGTVLAGPGFADYAADGILLNANVAMFDLTEAPLGIFATGAPVALGAKIAANAPFFGTARTDLDPANSDIDLSAGKLHLAQTDGDWNGIKNLEIKLDSDTSFRDIRLENFVDTRLKIGDVVPDPDQPQGAVFDVALLGTKRGEVDASHAPAALELTLDVWSNFRVFQNSFDIKGSVFDDAVTIGPGAVGLAPIVGEFDPPPPPTPPWYIVTFEGENGDQLQYRGVFSTVSTNLGAGDDQYDTFTEFTVAGGAFVAGEFIVNDNVWGGSGDDTINTGYDNDRLFGDNGTGAWRNLDPLATGAQPGNDELNAGAGRDWIEGNGDRGEVVIRLINGTGRFLDLATQGDEIDCGTHFVRAGGAGNVLATDADSDIVNFNAGDGFDVVFNFGAGVSPNHGFPFENVHDVLRIENVGVLTTEVINSGEGMGTLVQNGAGSVFLVGEIEPLAQSIDGKYLLLFDAS